MSRKSKQHDKQFKLDALKYVRVLSLMFLTPDNLADLVILFK